MFRTIKLIRLHARCSSYLELIQQANNNINKANADLYVFDGIKDPLDKIRLMHYRREYTVKIARYENVSAWLATRYERVIIELDAESAKRSPKKLLTTSENY